MARKPPRAQLEKKLKALEEEIAERKRAEEALRQSEANYRLLFSAETDAIIVMDAKTKVIVDANESALKLYGYDREEFIGQSAAELATDPERLAHYLENVALEEPFAVSPGPVERLHRTKEGKPFPVEISSGVYELGTRRMVCAIVRDISERKQAQEALEQSNIAMLDILESISDGFFSLDHQFIVTYFNAAAGRLLGRKSWEVLGNNFVTAFPEFKDSIFEEKINQAFNEKTSLSFETYFDVEPYENWYDVRVYSREGGVSVFFRVTTGLKEAEEVKNKLEGQLQQAKKMRAIGALAGGIANDFNNLLSVIQANASLVQLEIDPQNPCYANFKKIEKQVNRGAELSAQLLGYAGKGRYKVKTIDMNQIVERTAKAFWRRRRSISVHWELADNLLPIEADPVQLEQVLRNLYVNAADAMPQGGDLVLQTSNVACEDMDEKFHCPEPTDYVLITVTDTGIGIDESSQERVFEPFFTTKGSRKRPGLGLTAAYGIVEGHDGYIDFDSSKGDGTSFHIYLPASQKTVEEVLPINKRLSKGSGTVLVVDDDPMIIEVAHTLLEILGYAVIAARGGREALQIYREKHDNIDLVILDMIMPEVDGSETYDRMKRINPDVKVVLTTGYSIDGKATEILERGCNGFLQKPFTINDLSKIIDEILSE